MLLLFVVLVGIEHRALDLLSKSPTSELHPQSVNDPIINDVERRP